ncbi:MAG TPA: CheR family methyltransferase [Gemmataceae bacterium]|jgi:chemotaxis protein methyltransferase WspC|nr:CheR family methyltransferase [Gemmataceae bacterium]
MSVQAVTALLRERLGLDPGSLGPSAINDAVAVRMRVLGRGDLTSYASSLAGDAEEFQALAEEISVPETWFFRGGLDLFAYLAALIRAAGQGAPGPFRVLSAPCSGGEEAYSLAIALAEIGVPLTAFTIEGIDISRPALEKARAGRYGDLSFRQTDPALRAHYFQPVADGWEIRPALRDACRFRLGNLMEPVQPCVSYHLIFCRNLLIYLHAAARVQVLDNLMRCLAVDGLLCMAHAEPMLLHDPRFEMAQPNRFMLFRRVAAKNSSAGDERKPLSCRTVVPMASPEPVPMRASSPRTDEDDLARARRLADAGQIDDALSACTAHLDRAGPSASAYSLLGVLRQAHRDEDEARRCFEKALYLDPNHDEALTHLMLLHQQRGDAGRAAILRQRLAQTRGGGER